MENSTSNSVKSNESNLDVDDLVNLAEEISYKKCEYKYATLCGYN